MLGACLQHGPAPLAIEKDDKPFQKGKMRSEETEQVMRGGDDGGRNYQSFLGNLLTSEKLH